MSRGDTDTHEDVDANYTKWLCRPYCSRWLQLFIMAPPGRILKGRSSEIQMLQIVRNQPIPLPIYDCRFGYSTENEGWAWKNTCLDSHCPRSSELRASWNSALPRRITHLILRRLAIRLSADWLLSLPER